MFSLCVPDVILCFVVALPPNHKQHAAVLHTVPLHTVHGTGKRREEKTGPADDKQSKRRKKKTVFFMFLFFSSTSNYCANKLLKSVVTTESITCCFFKLHIPFVCHQITRKNRKTHDSQFKEEDGGIFYKIQPIASHPMHSLQSLGLLF